MKEQPVKEHVIPELEDIIRTTPPRAGTDWTEEEDAIITRYYGKPGITIRILKKHLPGRTSSAIQTRASRVLDLEIKHKRRRP